jgi:hypothetical protein
MVLWKEWGNDGYKYNGGCERKKKKVELIGSEV